MDEAGAFVAAEEFGPYRLESLIGRGGMGEVYRAFDTVKKRIVAVKRLPVGLAADAVFEDRFRRESEVAARLREPHVIPIHDFGEINGQLFIDMRLVEGTDLVTVLAEQGPLPPIRAVNIVAQVASALDAAHRDGLVHRDVKPSNVLISGEDGEDFVYLIDFGIAQTMMGTALTATGATIGTLAYMAPERFLQQDRGDHRVDVYSLGCLLHEALTGMKPFPGDDLPIQMYAHINTPPPRPSTHRPATPPEFDTVIAQGMAKAPEHRYQRAGELAAAARTALALPASTPVTAANAAANAVGKPAPTTSPSRPAPTPPPGTTHPRRPRRPRRAVLVSVAAVIVVAAVIAGVITLNRSQPTEVAAEPGQPASNLTAASTIDVGPRPLDVAFAPDGRRAYVTGLMYLQVIDTSNGAVTDTISIAGGPNKVVVAPDARSFQDRQVRRGGHSPRGDDQRRTA